MFNIEKIVNAHLIDKARKNNRDYSYFHASEWDKCHRKIAYEYYEAKGYIKIDGSSLRIDPKLERIFDNGHFMHSRWRSYLIATGALMGKWECTNRAAHKDETKMYGRETVLGVLKPDVCECGQRHFHYHEVNFLDETTNWGGSVDAILDTNVLIERHHDLMDGLNVTSSTPEDRYLIVDFKSMGSFMFKGLERPLPQHITQINIYLYLSGLKNGKFIYENKDNQQIKEYAVTLDQNLIAVKKAEAMRLKHVVTNPNSSGLRVLPPRGYDSRGDDECVKCKYRAHCWGI